VVGGFFCEKPVAVKISKHSNRSTIAKSFIDIGNEVRVLRRARHPNIVLFYGAYVDEQQGDLALVMEKITGCLLSVFILGLKHDVNVLSSCTSLTTNQFWQLSSNICHALIYLHSRKPSIVHSDLKPSNIAVEASKAGLRPKLLDFGLSRILSNGTKMIGRTVFWASPEVLRRPDDLAQTSSDVFAFGCILYFMLTSRAPREGQTEKQVFKSARKGKVLRLRWPLDDQRAEVCRPIVAQCVDFDCNARSSINDAFTRLGQVLFPSERHVNLGEHPSSEVLCSTRHIFHSNQSKEALRSQESLRNMDDCLELHRSFNVKIPVYEDSLSWLRAVVVDCDLSEQPVPVSNCTLCYSSLPTLHNTIILNMPACLEQWMKLACFEMLVDAMKKFLNGPMHEKVSYPSGVQNIVFTSMLKTLEFGDYPLVGSAVFCELVPRRHSAQSNSGKLEDGWLVRIAFTNLRSWSLVSSPNTIAKQSNLIKL